MIRSYRLDESPGLFPDPPAHAPSHQPGL